MTICPKCQSPIQENGQCSLCLLQVGMNTWDSYQPSGQRLDSNGLAAIEEIASYFPQLTIHRLIGRGGMGAIYLARQTSLAREVAVKLISKNISNEPMFLERFEREARALARLNHPHIVTVFDSGRAPDGTAYLIMEFIDGINLREAIQSIPITVEDAINYVSKMALALQYAHEKGIVHRDMKPENVLLGEDGSLKIVDFGIAKILAGADGTQDNLTRTRQVLGTPHYLAPEHLEAYDQVDHRVDLYSLGVLFYELLTRKLPLGHFEQPSAINPNVTPSVDRIVSKCMQRNPSLRYQTASELNEDLKALAGSSVEPTLVASHTNRGISVPFECETLGGFTSTRGMIRATDRGLRIEYKLADEVLRTFKSQLHTLEIPRENLIRIDFKNGWFNKRLSMVVDSIELLDNFPNSESGSIDVKIKRDDQALAEQVVDAMNLTQHGVKNAKTNDGNRPKFVESIVVAILTILGIMNFALSALVIASFPGGPPLGVGFINRFTVLGTGLIGIVQILLAILFLMISKRFIINMALILTVLPISPLFVIGVPFTIWALTRFSKNTGHNDQPVPSKKSSPILTTPFNEPESLDPITGAFLSILGIANTLFLAWLWTQNSYDQMNRDPLILPCLVGGTLVAATQLLSLVLSIVTGKRSLTKSAIVASTIPVTPLAIIGIPFAIWYWKRPLQSTSSHPASVSTHKSRRGATTLMWLREKRVAKMFSVLDTLVGSLVILGISIFFFGLYPTRLDYRLLIAPDLDRKAKEDLQQVSRDAIRARLAGLKTVTDSKADPMPSIQAWAFQRTDIVNRLLLTRAPKLHILVPHDWSASVSVEVVSLPIAQDLNDAKSAFEMAPFGKVVRCIEVPGGLASDRVRGIAQEHPKGKSTATPLQDFLVIEWSQQGRKELETILTNSNTNAKTMFGIEIDGTIVAVSELQWLDGSKTSFELSATSRWNVDSIIAAVRGPEIPCELERLSR